MDLSPGDLDELRRARALLHDNNLAVRVSAMLGGQMNRGLDFLLARLPGEARVRMREAAHEAAGRALERGYRAALATVRTNGAPSPRWRDKAATALTGFAGGAAGLAGTAIELPVTTTLLLRAILRIAAEAGEDVRSDDARIECIKVLAFGAPSIEEDAGYWTVRLALSQAIGAAAGRSLGELLPRVVAQVAPRFGVNVAWKFAGQALPLAGAAAGAMMNVAFTDHYQDKARGHFAIRRLEREYGATAVRQAYEALA